MQGTWARRLATTIAAVLIIALTGCGDNNYPGEGNEFKLTATVTGTADHSIHLENVIVSEANGLSAGWFDDPTHREIFDGFQTYEDEYVVVGTIYNGERSLKISSLAKSQRIKVFGKIRPTSHGFQHQAVFDRIDIQSG